MSTAHTLTLDVETLAELERLAAQRGITPAEMLHELVRSYAATDLPRRDKEDWPEWMDPDAIDAVKSGLTTVERLRRRREVWRRQAEAPLTPEQEEERAGWMRIREAAAAELLRRSE
jgi:hypothetical protein